MLDRKLLSSFRGAVRHAHAGIIGCRARVIPLDSAHVLVGVALKLRGRTTWDHLQIQDHRSKDTGGHFHVFIVVISLRRGAAPPVVHQRRRSNLVTRNSQRRRDKPNEAEPSEACVPHLRLSWAKLTSSNVTALFERCYQVVPDKIVVAIVVTGLISSYQHVAFGVRAPPRRSTMGQPRSGLVNSIII